MTRAKINSIIQERERLGPERARKQSRRKASRSDKDIISRDIQRPDNLFARARARSRRNYPPKMKSFRGSRKRGSSSPLFLPNLGQPNLRHFGKSGIYKRGPRVALVPVAPLETLHGAESPRCRLNRLLDSVDTSDQFPHRCRLSRPTRGASESRATDEKKMTLRLAASPLPFLEIKESAAPIGDALSQKCQGAQFLVHCTSLPLLHPEIL